MNSWLAAGREPAGSATCPRNRAHASPPPTPPRGLCSIRFFSHSRTAGVQAAALDDGSSVGHASGPSPRSRRAGAAAVALSGHPRRGRGRSRSRNTGAGGGGKGGRARGGARRAAAERWSGGHTCRSDPTLRTVGATWGGAREGAAEGRKEVRGANQWERCAAAARRGRLQEALSNDGAARLPLSPTPLPTSHPYQTPRGGVLAGWRGIPARLRRDIGGDAP